MYSSIAVAALLGSPLAAAFPHIAEMVANQQAERRQDVGLPTGAVPFPVRPGSPAHALYSDFDPASQLVSTSGDHAWAAPTAGQIRGPCAGLNAAANHGYLPRSGIATTESVNTGLWQAYGLSLDATAVLQTATMFFDGDPLSGRWSIGYHSDDTQSLGALGTALGNETGICAYGHLKTEADASITRGDWLAPEDNSNCASYPKFMQELFDLADEMEPLGDITPRVMAQHSANRKAYSIATNPNYFAPPYAGVAFTFGAHMFAFELLANHSAEHPTGFLTKENFMSFFSYSNATGSLVYTYGHERIPDNWYKRADADAWTANDIAISTAQQCASYPSNCQVGGNTGTVNSFAGVDPGDITGGFITAFTELSDPAKMGCFIRQNLQAEVPSFLDKFANAAVLGALQNAVTTQLLPSLAGLGECSGLPAGRSMFDSGSSYAKFPGAQNVGVAGARAPYRK